MSDVSVIGCGNMGSALVRVLAAQGKDVTVWNRTIPKADALEGANVSVATSIRAAVRASPTTLVSISDYSTTRSLLQPVRDDLREKALVQLSSGKPSEARELNELVTATGASYVDGAIMSYPSHVGSPSFFVLYSGDGEVFERLRSLLESLGGTAMYLGTDPGAASALDLAALVPVVPMAVGIWQGARICATEGIPLDTYSEFIEGMVPVILEDSLAKARDPDFATDPEKIECTVSLMEQATGHISEYLRDVEIDSGSYDALHRLYAGGIADGRGSHDWCCSAELHASPPAA